MKLEDINDEWLFNNCKSLMEYFFSMNENIDKKLFDDYLIDYYQNMVVVYYQSLDENGQMRKDFLRDDKNCYAILSPDEVINNKELDGYTFGRIEEYLNWKSLNNK